MSEIVIAVQGSHAVRVAPERATVRARVSCDGPEPAPVMERLQAGLAAVRGELARLQEAGAVERHSVQRASTSADRPWNADGRQLPLVHTAAASASAEFADFDALGAWIGWTAGVEGATVDQVTWSLTPARRREVEREARQEAVRQARLRAQDYADALDLGPVTVRSISDPGVSTGPVPRVAKFDAAAASAPELGLDPEDLEIAATVEATFVAGSQTQAT